MSWVPIAREGVELWGRDVGDGPAVVFQHGLGGDEAQVAGVFPDGPFRRLTLECRAHGRSAAGDPGAFSFATFARDVLAYAEARGVERFAVGGISMGAALALRLAVEAPEPVTALILARPAWGWDAAPDNMRPFAEAAPFLGQSDREGFAATATARRLAEEAPDNLASLLGFFERPERATLAELIRAIAADGPGVSEAAARRLRAPTLVLGCEVDRVHPLALAKMLAATIPRARFVELTPKARDPARHAAEFREAVAGFLAEALPPRAGEGRAPSPALRGRGPG